MTAVSTRWAMIDDGDPSIHYSPGWVTEQGNPEEYPTSDGKPYLNTLHRLSQNGSLSFDYYGSSIYVWGLDPGDGKRASWRCSVDGIQIPSDVPSGPVPQNNWPLCQDGGLLNMAAAMGLHTLTINVTVTSSDNAFRVDWFEYRPQPGFVFDSPSGQRDVSMLIENTDPAIIFDDGWRPWTNLSQTGNATSQVNSKAMIDFNGTSLSWFGIGEPVNFSNTARGSYSIDGEPDVVFSWKTDPSIALDRRFLFETPNLSFGPHRAIVKYLGPAFAPSLILDYLVVQNASVTRVVSSELPDASRAAPSQTPEQHTGSGGSAGIIAGAVVGGLALVVIILLVWFGRRLAQSGRRKQGEVFPYTLINEVPQTTSVVPPKAPASHSRAMSDPWSQTSERLPILSSADLPPVTNDSYRRTAGPIQSLPQATDHTYPPDQGISISPGESLPRYTEFHENER